MKIPTNLAATGRVKDWIKNPEKRLPVSCTVFDVKDSMEEPEGIEDSWVFTSKALRNGAGVAINLSNLRAKGTENGKGLISSGAVSFASFYSHLNEVLRRGGMYKNGAVTLFLDYDHGDAEDYLNATPNDLPWAKKALYVDDYLLDSPLIDLIIQRVKEGSIWLAKKQWDQEGVRLYSNVCLEILLQPRGSCLLSHVNLGACSLADIPTTFKNGMTFLCQLHAKTGVGESGIYLNAEQDRQVGLGVVGLANLLAIHKVTYADFVNALEQLLDIDRHQNTDISFAAIDIAKAIISGYEFAAKIAKSYDMDRAFCIAPTASVAYRYRDSEGYTLAPEISPPINLVVDRDSGTFGVMQYEHNPDSETARKVGWDVQYRLMKAWQLMMDDTELAHSISFNIWDTCDVDRAFLIDWLKSPLKTTYYRLAINQAALDKSQVITEENIDQPVASCNISGFCTSCAE